ncbi:hypothetical protein STENM223S_04834 [Streptomyces tendae]
MRAAFRKTRAVVSRRAPHGGGVVGVHRAAPAAAARRPGQSARPAVRGPRPLAGVARGDVARHRRQPRLAHPSGPRAAAQARRAHRPPSTTRSGTAQHGASSRCGPPPTRCGPRRTNRGPHYLPAARAATRGGTRSPPGGPGGPRARPATARLVQPVPVPADPRRPAHLAASHPARRNPGWGSAYGGAAATTTRGCPRSALRQAAMLDAVATLRGRRGPLRRLLLPVSVAGQSFDDAAYLRHPRHRLRHDGRPGAATTSTGWCARRAQRVQAGPAGRPASASARSPSGATPPPTTAGSDTRAGVQTYDDLHAQHPNLGARGLDRTSCRSSTGTSAGRRRLRQAPRRWWAATVARGSRTRPVRGRGGALQIRVTRPSPRPRRTRPSSPDTSRWPPGTPRSAGTSTSPPSTSPRTPSAP